MAHREPSAEDSAIPVGGIKERWFELVKNLITYKEQLTDQDLGNLHPSRTVLYGHSEPRLKADILEAVLGMAIDREATDKIYLQEVAVQVHDVPSLDVIKAATIPFQRNEADGTYEPDIPSLLHEAGRTAVAFSIAYDNIRRQCMGIKGGTGLPEA